MNSVNAAGSGLSNLLQTLSAEIPQISSVLSSPKVQSALQNASPIDTIHLSEAALQLQNVGQLFGGVDGTAADSSSNAFNALFPTATTDPLIPTSF